MKVKTDIVREALRRGVVITKYDLAKNKYINIHGKITEKEETAFYWGWIYCINAIIDAGK